MCQALVATFATSGLSLFFHVLRFLWTPVDPVVPSSDLSLDPVTSICLALASDSTELVHGLLLPSLVIGICLGLLLIPFCEAVLTAHILAFKAALRRFGYEERAPLYRLL